MKRLFCLLLLCLLPMTGLAEGFTPIPWTEIESPNAPNPACYLPDEGGYHDDSIDIRVEKTYWDQELNQLDGPQKGSTTVMAVYVTLTDVSQFRTRSAGPFPSKKTRHVSDMTKRAKAVMGINGDYFIYHEQGIVYRNGKQLRMRPHKGRDTLIVDEKGDFHIITPTTKAAWEAYIGGGGTVLHAFCFGPGLVVNGEPVKDLDDIHIDNGKGKKAQRMVIGQTGPLQYLILTNEGPESTDPKSVGFNLLQMAQLCKKLGLENAYNLDGGSSATVSLNNDKINSRSSHKIRLVGDCIWFATLVPESTWKSN